MDMNQKFSLEYILIFITLIGILSIYHHGPNMKHLLDDKTKLKDSFPCAMINSLPKNLTWHKRLQVYLDGTKPILWTYYDDVRHMTNLMRLSLGTISCHNSNGLSIVIASDKEVSKLLGGVHELYKHLTPNHKSDYFRVHILEKFGGAYVDIDVIALEPSFKTYTWLKHYDVIGQLHGPTVSVGYLGPVRAQTTLFKQWAAAQKQVLSQHTLTMKEYLSENMYPKIKPYPIPWSALIHVGGGLESLFSAYEMNPKSALKLMDGTRYTAQLSYSHGTFNQTTDMRLLRYPVILNKAPFLYWHNALLLPMRSFSVDEIFSQHFLFIEVLAHSYKLCLERNLNVKRGLPAVATAQSLNGFSGEKLVIDPSKEHLSRNRKLQKFADEYSARCLGQLTS